MTQQRRKKKGALTVPGEYLQALCVQKGWTWKQLGEEAGIDPSLISRAFQGKVKPQPANIEAFCIALGIVDENTKDDIFLSFRQVRESQYERAIASLQRKIDELPHS